MKNILWYENRLNWYLDHLFVLLLLSEGKSVTLAKNSRFKKKKFQITKKMLYNC